MPSRREPIWTGNFIAVSFVNLFVFLSFQMIFPTLPLYVKSLGGSDAVIGLVMGIFTAATLIARPTAGILLDRIGKKKVLLCGLGVFTVMVYLYGMVGSIALIILVRLGHGLGWGLAGTSTATIAAEIIPKSRFAEGMGWFSPGLFAAEYGDGRRYRLSGGFFLCGSLLICCLWERTDAVATRTDMDG